LPSTSGDGDQGFIVVFGISEANIYEVFKTYHLLELFYWI